MENLDHRNFKLRSIREARLEKGLSQEQLAEKAGIKQQHLTQIETGRINPTWNTSKVLAEVLKENPLDLALGQILENVEIDKEERPEAVKYLLENRKLQMAAKNILKVEKDFGERDSFGRKIKEKEIERDSLGKRTEEKEFERDSFGRRVYSGT